MKPLVKRLRAAAIAAYVPDVRQDLAIAQTTDDDETYTRAKARLVAALPQGLWIGRDGDLWLVQSVAPVWITEDPAGEDPTAWTRIDRDEIARSLLEDT